MKKCKNCGERFEPRFTTLEKYCWNPDCKTIEALEKLPKAKKAQWRATKKRMIEKTKTLSDYKKELQKVFNAWIRKRDAGRTCISCDKLLRTGSKYDAGHYFPRGSFPSLSFEPTNCHSQCVECNQHRHGNLIEYRIGLIKRYGEKYVDELESKRNDFQKFTIQEIKDFIKFYKAELKKD